MQSIFINKADSFVFHFYDTSMKIEREGRSTQEVAYNEVVSCRLVKGEQQVLATFFVIVISLFTHERIPLKIFKVHDQLLIELKNNRILDYQVRRNMDENNVHKVVNFIIQKKRL